MTQWIRLQVDETAVDRIVENDPPAVERRIDRRAALRRMWDAGCGDATMAAVLRISVDGVRRARYRAGLIRSAEESRRLRWVA